MKYGLGTELSDAAGRQAGVLTISQLLVSLGTRASIRTLVGHGTIRQVSRGVYVVCALPPSWEQTVWVAALAAGPTSFVFRRSAARWWGLDGAGKECSSRPDVAVGPGHQSRRTGVTRLESLLPDDVVDERGLRVTTVERTLLDLGAVVGDETLERSIECALRRRAVDLDRLRQRAGCTRTAGARRLDALLRRRGESPPTESDAETLFLHLARGAGLPEPNRQYRVLLGGRRCRLDFAWPQVRLAVEVDGFGAHGSPAALHADLGRQNHLVLDGWVLLRFTWNAIVGSPREVQADLRRAWRMAMVSQLGA